MAKRMLSLLLAMAMVLGMVPAVSMAVTAEEAALIPDGRAAAAVSAPAWSANFDDPDKAYTATGANSVWSGYDPTLHTITVEEDGASGNNYLQIVGEPASSARGPFNLRSVFAPMSSAAMTMDVYRSAADMDGFRILFESTGDGSTKTIAEIMVWFYSGEIVYSFNGDGSRVNTGFVIAPGAWTTLSVAVAQNAGEGDDQIIVSCGGETKTFTGTFTNENAVVNRMNVTAGGSDWYTVTKGLCFDNMAVYPYAPAEEVSLDKEAAALAVEDTLQLNATVASNAGCITDVKWTSSDDQVVTVDQTGKVTAVGAGEATVTVTVTNVDGSKVTDTCAITVNTPIVPVTPVVSTPIWSADFDDPSKVYAGTGENSVWTEYSPAAFAFSIEEESAGGNKYMKLIDDPNSESTTAFALRSEFAPMKAAVVSVDVYRKVADKDGFRILFEATGSGKSRPVAEVLVWYNSGKVAYSFGGENPRYTIDDLVIAPGQWTTLTMAIVQSEEEGKDQIIISCGGKTRTITGTFTYTNEAANRLWIGAGGGSWNTVADELRFDNLAVYPYVPAQDVTLDKEAAALDVEDTLQLNAKVMSNASCITAVEWSSSDNKVATVDQTGKVTAVGGGEATVTVTVTNADGSKVTDTCAITVNTPMVPVAPAVSTPIWSADFDDPSKVYTGTGENSVWTDYTTKEHVFTIEEGGKSGKYLKITDDPNSDQKAAFSLRSVFESMNAAAVTMDVYRSAADKDGFRILFEATGNGSTRTVAEILVWFNSGRVDYSFTAETTDRHPTGLVIAPGEWTTLSVAIVQSAEEGKDQIIISCGGQTEIVTGTFVNTDAGVNRLCIAAGASSWNTVTSDLRLDNLAVYPYAPAEEVTLNKESVTLEVGQTEQLSATVLSNAACITAVKWKSGNRNVATVDQNGLITAVGGGTTTITVTVVNAGGPQITDTVTVTVLSDSMAPVWNVDFDDDELVYTDATSENSVWSAYRPNAFTLAVEEDSETGNKYFKITDDPASESGTAFVLRSEFDAMNAVVFALDIFRSESNRDGFRILFEGVEGNSAKIVAEIMLWYEHGKVAYSFTGSEPRTNTDIVLDAGKWETLTIIVVQSEEEGQDQITVSCGGKTHTVKGTFANTNAAISQLQIAGGGSNWNTVTEDLRLDNLAVYAYVPAQSVEIPEETITINGHENYQITPVLTPAQANDLLSYTSSDPSVVMVNDDGLLTGVGVGTAVITLKASENVQDTVTVTVVPVAPEQIELNIENISLPVGAHTFLQATVKPDNALPNTVTITSSDESIVTVDAWGELVCLKAGTVTITATCGNVSKSVSVTVSEPAVMKTIRVSPSGTSLADALAQIAAINATAEGMTGNIEVILASGYYYIDETIKMNELHGGTNGYSVVWKAAEGATPIIGGGKYFSGSLFADEDNDGIYTIDLAELGIPKVADPDTMATTRQLFVNNVRATRARSEGGLTNARYYMDGSKNLGHVSEDTYLADFARIRDLEFVYQELWTNPRAGVSAITKNEDGTINITMDQPGWKYTSNKGASSAGADGPKWIENALELLDQPGEWYLNEETQILYYMPRSWEDMAAATFMLPLMDDYDPDGGISGLMYIEGTDYDNMVHNIRFEGITFADTTWTRPSTLNCHSDAQNNHIRENGDYLTEAAITVTKANGVCFTGCTFTRLGITAVKLVKGVQNSHFVGNHFYDISGGAINIGDPLTSDKNNTNPSDPRMMMKNCDVLNNYIHNTGADFDSSAAISLGFGPNMDFSYNEIFNMPYSGYHIGYGWQQPFENNLKNLVISHNFIHDFMGDGVADGGGVYTLGNTSGDGYNKIHSNYVKTVMDVAGPLYCDEGSTYYEVYNNLVDLSKVSDWKGDTVMSWLQMNGGSHHLWVHDNFATVSKYYWNSTGSEVENAQLEDPNNWSAGAQAVIDGAGLQSEYAHLRNGHAELIVTNLDESKEMRVGESFQIGVSFTDGKDKPVSGGNYIVAYDSKDPAIAEVSADGLIVAKSCGITTVRIWVVSNDVLVVTEHTVVVDDELDSIILKNVEREITMSTSAAGWQLTTMIASKLGRVLTPDSVTFSTADEQIAAVNKEGFLKPIAAGTTSLTVTATYGGARITNIFKVVITAPAGIRESDAADMFEKDNESYWMRNKDENWEVVDGTSVTGKFSSYATFSGTKYDNELLCFKLKIDKNSGGGGWPSIVLRAQGATGEAQAGEPDAYVFCMGTNGVEVYRFIDGVRYVIRGNQGDNGTTVIRLSGAENIISPEASGFTYTDGVAEHDIKIGAIADNGNVRLLLYVDGNKVLDYLDVATSGAISLPGYFGMIGRGETFTLTKDTAISDDSDDGESGDDPVVDTEGKAALIGNSAYETLEEALAAATAGDTVKLLADAEVTELILSDKITLDLNGYDLTAGYLVAFGDSGIIDSAPGVGLLKSKHVRLAANNPMMPIWVEADGGYRIFTMKDSQLYLSQSESGFVFIAKPVLGKAANAPYMALADNGLSVKARMSWKSAAGNDVEQFFVLKGEDVQKIYSDTNQIIQLTVNGAGAYIGRLSTTIVIESETGVIWAGVPLLYTGN